MYHVKNVALVLFLFVLKNAFCQGDTSTVELTKDNLFCVYNIDNIWTDSRTAYKRPVIGEVNFFQIENGMVSTVGRTSKNNFLFAGMIDSLETAFIDSVSILRIYATTNYGNVTNYPYIFEISEENESSLLIMSRRRRTVDIHYFRVHASNDAEIAEIRKYFLENTPKY